MCLTLVWNQWKQAHHDEYCHPLHPSQQRAAHSVLVFSRLAGACDAAVCQSVGMGRSPLLLLYFAFVRAMLPVWWSFKSDNEHIWLGSVSQWVTIMVLVQEPLVNLLIWLLVLTCASTSHQSFTSGFCVPLIPNGNTMSVNGSSHTWGSFALQLRAYIVSVCHKKAGTSGRQ